MATWLAVAGGQTPDERQRSNCPEGPGLIGFEEIIARVHLIPPKLLLGGANHFLDFAPEGLLLAVQSGARSPARAPALL